ncbi:protein-disulfide reductase DsbD [Caldimonas thermodepolymerans]|uniref:protein-disulfide reductase DsbD n=1 Tax=Caldimonas thermodepolymerans TaxID=215580 RepID=UPI0022366015|nr:protein-disulfide reductase DsbD [Caldimonas thermodepolymerans]UZG43888.1 protein-disulfide reductase DsbD [Caldimonas thermodepolymerans]
MTGAIRWLLAALLALGLAVLAGGVRADDDDDFLEPEVAFRFAAAALDERTLELRFDVADGYYMYREQFRFAATPPAVLGTPEIPRGEVKYDRTFEKDVETHRGTLRIRLPVVQAEGPFRLTVTSQGCADKGLCYPPMDHHVEVALAAFGAPANRVALLTEAQAERWGASGGLAASLQSLTGAAPVPANLINTRSPTDSDRIAAALESGRLPTVVAVFFVAGVLLSLTPCVLPMLPILSSIIVGQAEADGRPVSRGRAFGLAASYSLGMALVYTAFGVAAGLAGEGLAAWLQTPWVLGAFAALLVLLALSMFGFYELQLPSGWRDRVQQASGRLHGGRFLAVFLMGGLSALIVSPCVAAPLAGALVYISQTRDVVLGGAALFALAAGMSVPLLLIGASAGRWLPRGGAWMEHVKHFFGALLIAVAIWMLQPVLPGWLAMLLWGALLLVAAVYLKVFDTLPPGARGWQRFFKGVGVVLAVLGAIQLVGAASGGRDPWQPLAHLARAEAATDAGLGFEPVRSVEELEAVLARAGRPVMLDFYADWCVSCKEMEAFTFSDPRVRARLANALLLKADVTANNRDDRALLKRFGLFGPPGTLFFDASGRELPQLRVIGFQSADRFLQTLDAAGL